MVNSTDFWVVEWSNSQKRFHIDRLDFSLRNNVEAMREDRPNDYILVALANSHKEASEHSRELKPFAKGFVPLPIA